MTIDPSPPTRKGRKLFVGCVSTLAFLFVGGLIAGWLLTREASPTPPPLPDPNGYDDVIAASRAIQKSGVDLTRKDSDDPEILRGLVEPNREALARARVGLGRPFQVPVEYSMAFIQTQLDTIGELRTVGYLLEAEGRLADREGRPEDALRSYLDMLRLGRAMGRDSLMNHYLTSVAVQSRALRGLKDLTLDLDPESIARVVTGLATEIEPGSIRRVIAALERADRDRQPAEEVIRQELAFMDNNLREMGPFAGLAFSASGFLDKQKAQVADQMSLAERWLLVQLRLQRADLAIRLHQREHGDPPDRLQDLVPDYLESVPEDPYGKGPLIYRRLDDGYQLYSVGHDGRDDHLDPVLTGKHTDKARGDIALESF